MIATLTAYLNYSDRIKAQALIKSIFGKQLEFYEGKDHFLGYVGEVEIDVGNQKEALEIERNLLSYDFFKDLEVVLENSNEEQLINHRYSLVNECFNEAILTRPLPTWYLENIKLEEAYRFLEESFNNGTGYCDLVNSKINLSLIDTGYSNHPEINRIDKLNGRNFLRSENFEDPLDTLQSTRPLPISWGGHGTSCAGVINGIKTSIPVENQIIKKDVFFNDLNEGLDKCQNINVVPFRVSKNIISFSNKMPKAINYIIQNNVSKIISMSHASLLNRKIYRLATLDAYNKGIILVAAPGSHVFQSRKVYTYPAKYRETIAPAASTIENIPWSYTHGGDEVDICAPGYEIYIPYPFKSKNKLGYGYKWSEGSSFAVPIVATAACLWRMHHGVNLDKYTPAEQIEIFRTIIRRTATRFNDPGINQKKYGSGIINFEKLLKEPLEKIYKEKKIDSRHKKITTDGINIFPEDKKMESIKRELGFLKLNEIINKTEEETIELDYFLDNGSEYLKQWLLNSARNQKKLKTKVRDMIDSYLNG